MKVRMLLLSLVLSIGSVGCVSGPRTEPPSSEPAARRSVRIGFSMATLKEERWQRDREAFSARCVELGVECEITVANNSAEKQLSDVEQLLTKGIDVLVIAPHDAKQAARIVETAGSAGVPVISYDRLILSADISLYVSHRIEVVGELIARYAVDRVPRGNYVLVFGGNTDNNAKIIHDVQKRLLSPFVESGEIRIVDEQFINDWSPDLAMTFAENALTKSGGDVQAFVVSNDGMAGGVIAALKKRGLAGKVLVTGQDAQLSALRNIAEGLQSMTVYKPIRPIAHAAVDSALRLARGEAVEGASPFSFMIGDRQVSVPAKLLEVRLVDKENLESTVIADGHAKREDVFRGK